MYIVHRKLTRIIRYVALSALSGVMQLRNETLSMLHLSACVKESDPASFCLRFGYALLERYISMRRYIRVCSHFLQSFDMSILEVYTCQP